MSSPRHAAAGRLGSDPGPGQPFPNPAANAPGSQIFLRSREWRRKVPPRAPPEKSRKKPGPWNFLIGVNKSACFPRAAFFGTASRRIEPRPAQSRGRPVRLGSIQENVRQGNVRQGNVRLLRASPPRPFGGSRPLLHLWHLWHGPSQPRTRPAPARSRRVRPRALVYLPVHGPVHGPIHIPVHVPIQVPIHVPAPMPVHVHVRVPVHPSSYPRHPRRWLGRAMDVVHRVAAPAPAKSPAH